MKDNKQNMADLIGALAEDIEEIKELGDKLWCPLLFLQTKVAHLCLCQ